jgi:hypothetical protein
MTRPLGRAFALFFGLGVLVPLSLAGCLKQKEESRVEKDGSGTMVVDVEIDMSALEEMGEQMKAVGGAMGAPTTPGGGAPAAGPFGGMGGDANPFESMTKRLKEVEGVKVTKTRMKMSLHTEATFASLEAYAKASSVEKSAKLAKNEDGSYTLTFEGADSPLGAMMGGAPKPDAAGMDGAGAPGGEMEAMGAMLLPMLEGFLKDFEIVRRLSLPGAVISTNGVKGDDGRTVTWKSGFEDMQSGKGRVQTVTFAGEGLDLKPFEVTRKPEMPGLPGGLPVGPPK